MKMQSSNVIVPNHIAIIPDGNRRWARKNNLSSYSGHKNGTRVVVDIVNKAMDVGIKYLTFYILSTENIKERNSMEIFFLLKIIKKFIHRLQSRQDVKVTIVGNINNMDEQTAEKFRKAKISIPDEFSAINNLIIAKPRIHLQFCINYSAQEEIVHAIRKIHEMKIDPMSINYETINQCLYTSSIPSPDLLIRTGNERRLSNFLLLQQAYTELYFSDKMWPEFTNDDLWNAILDFNQRERRFGQ